MPYTWPTTFSADQVLSGRGAKTTGLSLFEQQDALKQIRAFGWTFTNKSSTSSTPGFVVFSQTFFVPGYIDAAVDQLKIRFWLNITPSGTANCRFTLLVGAGSTTSTTQSTSSTSPVLVNCVSGLNADMAKTRGVINLELWTGGSGTAELSTEDLFFNCHYNSI